MKKINRRKFLKVAMSAAGATLAACNAEKPVIPVIPDTGPEGTSPTRAVYMPFLINGSTPAPSPTLTPTATSTPTLPTPEGIIADHTVVDKYSIIPQTYIDMVKKMWANIPGESHSLGYRRGCTLLQNLDSRFQANSTESGAPEPYSDIHLRISRQTWGDINNVSNWQYNCGEEDWYTSAQAIQRIKAHLTYCNTNNLDIAAFGFGWCWDMTWTNPPGGTVDPLYQVRWAGSSVNGPDGNLRWGLDSGDFALTANHVCMDTYLDATNQYISHCQTNNFPTKVFFTTGPVDPGSTNTGESGYQRELKNGYIRNFVKTSSTRILFDYADILCWSDAKQQNTRTWTDYGGTLRTFPYIHDDNMLDLNASYKEDGDHIGERGALRLGKALWWMFARMAGWDGNP